ncbi:MAG: hypothetical protein Q4A52_02505 [Bacillota bacterium]|nr:hypothetical protein [Bacillota bacterium]
MKRKFSRCLLLLTLLMLIVGCSPSQTPVTDSTAGASVPTGAQNLTTQPPTKSSEAPPSPTSMPETTGNETTNAMASASETTSGDTDAAAPVTVSFAEEKPDITPAAIFIADETEPQVAVLLQSEAVLNEVEILEFRYEESPQGMKVFPDVMTTIDELSPDRPLLVKMTFYGLYPRYGISYPDAQGLRRYFAVDMSGNDGSLYLLSIEPTTTK